ncbi:LysR family transcriptional regulator [Clostridium sp.]|uniref:LysR family transcriptional regulator n=1 Tax=Clostridium sp. TaxID=1506 RepID=UPI00262F4B19|nr:LysR family transcriptional regulator [Clostridium sp.]
MYNTQLETFIQVADAGSFSKAAKLLYITPTAVTKQINILESSLELQLFVRTHRGLILTEAGKFLYSDAKYIIQYSKESLERTRNAMKNNTNTIRIGTSFMTPSNILMELWSNIHELCPNLKIELVPFENTPENAREILMHLGQYIDVVPGVFDVEFLNQRKCTALELSRKRICCAVSIHHRLAAKSKLTIKDLFGENLMLIRRGWNSYVDIMRDDILHYYPEIIIKDFPFYDVGVFNQCENSNDILMAFDIWENVHPLLKILPVEWDYEIPFGLLHSKAPSEHVLSFIHAVSHVFSLDA